jgi:hypothetical protein
MSLKQYTYKKRRVIVSDELKKGERVLAFTRCAPYAPVLLTRYALQSVRRFSPPARTLRTSLFLI